MSDVTRLGHLNLSLAQKPWIFAQERREEIAAHFQHAQTKLPLWNGRLLLMHEHAFTEDTLTGRFLETDFASFLAWRDWGYPDPAMRNCFAQAALRGSDGAFILGVNSAHTANAGKIYFPSGTPDVNDVVDEMVDLDLSVARELEEETGLTPAAFELDAGWFAVQHRASIAMMKIMQAREPAEAVRARILDFIGLQKRPELSDAIVARGRHDISEGMAGYIVLFLRHIWRA